MLDALIAGMSVTGRSKSWTTILNSFAERGTGACCVAERDGVLQGFASCGMQRDEGLKALYSGEISDIYVQSDHQRAGLGRALMQSCTQALADMDLKGMALWGMSENAQARAFYEALGADMITERVDSPEDGALREVAYGWPSGPDLT